MIGKPEQLNVLPANPTSAAPLTGTWTSPVRLYRLEDGTVVEEDGVQDRAVLLVGAGSTLPAADAAALGLVAKYAAPEPTAANTRAVTDDATGEVVASVTDTTDEDAPADPDAFGRPLGKAVSSPPRTKAQAAPDGSK